MQGTLLSIERITLDSQSAQMITLTSTHSLQEPSESMRLRLLFSKKHEAIQGFSLVKLWTAPVLKSWSLSNESGLLFIQGSLPSKNETKAAAVHLTDMVRLSNVSVLWAFQPTLLTAQSPVSVTQILQYLSMQALRTSFEYTRHNLSENLNAVRVAGRARQCTTWVRHRIHRYRPSASSKLPRLRRYYPHIRCTSSKTNSQVPKHYGEGSSSDLSTVRLPRSYR